MPDRSAAHGHDKLEGPCTGTRYSDFCSSDSASAESSGAPLGVTGSTGRPADLGKGATGAKPPIGDPALRPPGLSESTDAPSAAAHGRLHVWSAASDDTRTTWTGECSCGWQGEPRHTCDEALRDGEAHTTAALGWKFSVKSTESSAPLLCRLLGHKTKQGNERRGMTETEPLPSGRGTSTRRYLWCFRCEQYIPGSLEIPTTRTFP